MVDPWSPNPSARALLISAGRLLVAELRRKYSDTVAEPRRRSSSDVADSTAQVLVVLGFHMSPNGLNSLSPNLDASIAEATPATCRRKFRPGAEFVIVLGAPTQMKLSTVFRRRTPGA